MKAGSPTHLNFLHELFSPVIIEEENIMLTTIPTEEKVLKVIHSLNPWKASGKDGFNGQFYSSCWTIIRQDVMSKIHNFFRGTPDLKDINQTLIVPIPKCATAQFVHELKPISL